MAAILSMFFTQKKIRTAYGKHQHIVNKVLGVALLVLAVIIAIYK